MDDSEALVGQVESHALPAMLGDHGEASIDLRPGLTCPATSFDTLPSGATAPAAVGTGVQRVGGQSVVSPPPSLAQARV